MMPVQIPKFPDVVFLYWERNPLGRRRTRIIKEFSIVYSASPCRSLIRKGDRLGPALRCLRRNGFTVVSRSTTTSVSGFLVLERK